MFEIFIKLKCDYPMQIINQICIEKLYMVSNSYKRVHIFFKSSKILYIMPNDILLNTKQLN